MELKLYDHLIEKLHKVCTTYVLSHIVIAMLILMIDIYIRTL